MNDSIHYAKKCQDCKIVYEQCRCVDRNKPLIVGLCPYCDSARSKMDKRNTELRKTL